jgi:hypothetical protein
MIRKVKNPGGYCLVSSDQEIVDAARNLGMDCLSTPEFTRLLTPVSESVEKDDNPQLSPEELAEWLAIFSDDGD